MSCLGGYTGPTAGRRGSHSTSGVGSGRGGRDRAVPGTEIGHASRPVAVGLGRGGLDRAVVPGTEIGHASRPAVAAATWASLAAAVYYSGDARQSSAAVPPYPNTTRPVELGVQQRRVVIEAKRKQRRRRRRGEC